jgi:hypothetical protein
MDAFLTRSNAQFTRFACTETGHVKASSRNALFREGGYLKKALISLKGHFLVLFIILGSLVQRSSRNADKLNIE